MDIEEQTRLIEILNNGGTIKNSSLQYLSKIEYGDYFLCCDHEGCCDNYFDERELIDYLIGCESWEVVGGH